MRYLKNLLLTSIISMLILTSCGSNIPFFQNRKSASVDIANGITLEEPNTPHVYIPSEGVSEQTDLIIKKVDTTVLNDAEAIGPAYDISLKDGYLRKSVEIALPIESQPLNVGEGEMFVEYLDGDEWVTLPSWYSEEDGMLHATMNHFTVVRPFYSPIPSRPKIVYKKVTPNPLENVGIPPCFEDDLSVWVGAEDPNNDIEIVEASLRLHTLTSEGVTSMVRFAELMNSLGLIMVAGDPTALLPVARTAAIQFTMKDPGSIGSDWIALEKIPGEDVYAGKINLSALSNCKNKFDVDAIMATVGLKKIDVNIKVTDSSGRKREDQVEIPVYSNAPASASLSSPGPTTRDIQGPRPAFQWQTDTGIAALDIEEIRLVYAKGNSLWDRWWGRKSVRLDWYEQEWIPEQDLSSGEYVWGVEVVSKDVTTRSNVYSFTVSKLWTELSVSGYTVKRTDITGNYEFITWDIYRGDELLLSRSAGDEMDINLRDSLGHEFTEGNYRVFITAVTKDFLGNPSKQQISNVATLQVEPTPTPIPSLTIVVTEIPSSTPVPPTSVPPTRVPPTPVPPTSVPDNASATLYLDQNYFCRVAPNSSAEDVTAFEGGSRFPIIATTNTGWWLVEIHLSWSSHTSCWIGGGIPQGDYSSVDIVKASAGSVPMYEYYQLEYKTTFFSLSCDELTRYRWGRKIIEQSWVIEPGPFYWDGDLVLQVYDCPRCAGDPKVFLASEGHRACPNVVN